MNGRDRVLLGVAAVLATAALAAGIGGTDLWPPDETRVAEIAREMAVHQEWFTPRLDGEPFLEEPPLFYWLQAAAYRLHGDPSAAAARWPATIAAVLGVLVTAMLARAAGVNAGLAALILATAPEYWWMARSGTPDTAAAASTGLGLTLFFLAWRSGRGSLVAGAVLAAAVAFWLKGFLGPGLAFVTAAAFMLRSGRGRLTWRQLFGGAIGFGVAVAAWVIPLGATGGGGAVTFFVLTNHLGRLVGLRDEGHIRSVLYYVPNLAIDLLPWSIALPAAVAGVWGAGVERRFVLLWAVTMTLALTVSASKRAHYLLPAYPAFAVLLASWWTAPGSRRLDRATWWVLATILLVACPLLTLGVLSLDPVAAMSAVLGSRRSVAPVTDLLFQTRPGAAAATAAAGVGVLALAFVVAFRSRNTVRAAVLAAACGTAIHLAVALVLLPRFNVFCSARSWGQGLGEAAREGSVLTAFGFPDRQALSPFLFYAGREIPQAPSLDHLEALLRARRSCAVLEEDAYQTLVGEIRRLPASSGTVGGLRFALVSGAAGGCPAAPPPVGPLVR